METGTRAYSGLQRLANNSTAFVDDMLRRIETDPCVDTTRRFALGSNLLGQLGRAPGASVGIGFQAAHTGHAATPFSVTLNGTTCAVT